jgi:hypothetical protein
VVCRHAFEVDRYEVGTAIRRTRRRILIRVVVVSAFGVYFASAGPLLLAPICWAAATVIHLRRGITILASLRDVPAAKPITDVIFGPSSNLATATALPARKSS